MKTVVLTTVYNGVENFLEDFLLSLENQSYKDFTLVILNDGLHKLKDYISNVNLNIKVLSIERKATIAQVRQIGIGYCLENKVKHIIFADSDDYFSRSRIEKSVEYLDNGYDIIINNLIIVNSAGNVIQENYFSELQEKKLSFNDIIDKNYFGLSNTAVNVKILEKVIPIPKEINAVDWWIFSILVYNNYDIKFIEDQFTYYRQYNSNLIGANLIINENYVKLCIETKFKHYFNLYRYFSNIDKRIAETFYDKYNKFFEIRNSILSNEDELKKYMDWLKQNKSVSNAWWNNVREYS